MKSTVLALIAVLLIGLAGIGGWYLAEKSRLAGESEDFAAEAEARELVQVAFVVDVPETTPDDQTVFVAGSHPELGAWQAAGLPLRRAEDGRYHGQCELLSGIEHEFKITRGTWSTVERDEQGEDLVNRPFRAEKDLTVDVAVAKWVDNGQTIPGRLTVTGDVRTHPKVASDLLELPRDLIVYLPPGYEDADNAETRYPVLYLNDGQNLFNESTSYAGIEWGVDEAVEDLILDGDIAPMIVVGIYNTENRDDEYTPGLKLDAYGQLVVNELKPMIDNLYRTQPDAAATGIGGSSLGGLAALAIAKDHPDTFGQVVALSPTLHVDGRTAASVLGDGLSALAGKTIYLDMGNAPTDNYPEAGDPVADAEGFVAALNAAGVDHTFAVIDGADHHEDDWADRIADVLRQVYGSGE